MRKFKIKSTQFITVPIESTIFIGITDEEIAKLKKEYEECDEEFTEEELENYIYDKAWESDSVYLPKQLAEEKEILTQAGIIRLTEENIFIEDAQYEIIKEL